MSNTTSDKRPLTDCIARIFTSYALSEITDKNMVEVLRPLGITAAGMQETLRDPNWGVGGRLPYAMLYTYDFYFEAVNIATCSVVKKKSTGGLSRLEITIHKRACPSSVVSALISGSNNNK